MYVRTRRLQLVLGVLSVVCAKDIIHVDRDTNPCIQCVYSAWSIACMRASIQINVSLYTHTETYKPVFSEIPNHKSLRTCRNLNKVVSHSASGCRMRLFRRDMGLFCTASPHQIFRPDIELSDRTLLEHSGRHTVIRQTCMHTCRQVITLAQGAQWGSFAEMWVFFANIRLYAHMSVDQTCTTHSHIHNIQAYSHPNNMDLHTPHTFKCMNI